MPLQMNNTIIDSMVLLRIMAAIGFLPSHLGPYRGELGKYQSQLNQAGVAQSSTGLKIENLVLN